MKYHKNDVDRMDADTMGDLIDQAMYVVEAAQERDNSIERYDVESGTFKAASY